MTSTPVDLIKFGHWLLDQQTNLVQEMYRQTREDQVTLVQKIQEGLMAGIAAQAADLTSPIGPSPLKVACLTEEDDIEAYLTSFEQTAKFARLPASQWTYILGPHLMEPAASVWRTLPMEALDMPMEATIRD